MEFIELSGQKLLTLLHEEEYQLEELRKQGVKDSTRVRINRQGDIEIFRDGEWDVIGGLLGDFAHRLAQISGLEWKPMQG